MKALVGRVGQLQHGCRRLLATPAAGGPLVMKAEVEGYGEGATCLVSAENFRFVVDEAPRMGGKGIGPNPLSLLLGSLVGCTQYTAGMVAKEMKLGGMGSVAWAASGEYDLRGVQGSESGVDARFKRITLEGTCDADISQQDLDSIAQQMHKRCIVAATLQASGMDMQLSLKKGAVDHQCEPACVLHELEEQGGGATGQVKGDPGRDADAPHFAGTAGQGRASIRGFASLARRDLHTTASWREAKDGEDVAREHLHAEAVPQLQKDTSNAGASTTAGGAYASRDDPRAQAGPPTEGKSDKQIIQEQGAGAYVHPGDAGKAEGGEPMEPEGASAPGYAERAQQLKKTGHSPLGDRPEGDE